MQEKEKVSIENVMYQEITHYENWSNFLDHYWLRDHTSPIVKPALSLQDDIIIEEESKM